MAMWHPWRGCHKISEGCKYCYCHEADQKKGQDFNKVFQMTSFTAPIDRNKNGSYKIKPGSKIYLTFSSDFFLEDADAWRDECWKMMRERSDCHFIFLTKRIHRFPEVIPEDWGDGYDNVTIGVSVSNKQTVEEKLPLLNQYPIKHKNIICQPLIEPVNITPYLHDIELVIVGGEYGPDSRPLDFQWVLDIREECIKANVKFEFRQCATHFIKDGQTFKLGYRQLSSQAKKANINYTP